jgi:3-hydroxyacyl-CoA dehydrogenase
MNHISQDYLIRPMGIFQLIDYVGVDVCSYIMSVMQSYHEGRGTCTVLCLTKCLH